MGDDPLPPLLKGLDLTTVAWAAGWALLLGLTRINRVRDQQHKDPDAPLTSWGAAIFDALSGSLLGGVLAALAFPTWFPEWREPGRIALLSVFGAAIAPYAVSWAVQIVVQLVAWFSERKIGVRIELKEEGGENHDDKPEES